MKRNSLKSTFLYYANQQVGANYVLPLRLNLKTRAVNACHHHGSADSCKCPMLLKCVCCANLCLYVGSLQIPRRWCGQNVNNVPLKLTCASVSFQPLFDVLSAGGKFPFRFPDVAFVTNFAGNRINCAASLIFRDWVFWFGK